MPIYEYRCQPCETVSSFFVRSIGSALEPVCPHCESTEMQRRMSSFAMGKTVGSVHENFPTGSEYSSPEYYQDPRNIGRNVERPSPSSEWKCPNRSGTTSTRHAPAKPQKVWTCDQFRPIKRIRP